MYVPVDCMLVLVGVAAECGVTGEGAEEWRRRLEERLFRMKLWTQHTHTHSFNHSMH